MDAKFKVGDTVQIQASWLTSTEAFIITAVHDHDYDFGYDGRAYGRYWYSGDRNNFGVWENDLVLVDAAQEEELADWEKELLGLYDGYNVFTTIEAEEGRKPLGWFRDANDAHKFADLDICRYVEPKVAS